MRAVVVVIALLCLCFTFQRTHAQATGACCAQNTLSNAFPAQAGLISDITCGAPLSESTCNMAGDMVDWEQGATCASSQSFCGCCPDSYRIAMNPSGDKICVDPLVFGTGFTIQSLINGGFDTFPACDSATNMCQRCPVFGNEEVFLSGSIPSSTVRYCPNCNVPIPVPPTPVPCPDGINTFCFCATITSSPTNTPTISPSAGATVSPTAIPTVAPTPQPSIAPTAFPTPAPTATPPPDPCTCPQAEALVVPALAVDISCASAVGFVAQAAGYSNAFASPVLGCEYSGAALPISTQTGVGAPCGETISLSWPIPGHPDCATSAGITLQQTVTVTRAPVATLVAPLPATSTLTCVQAEATLANTPTSLAFSNDEQALACRIEGAIPLVSTTNTLHTCGGPVGTNSVEYTWSGQTGAVCDTALSYVQTINALQAPAAVFDPIPSQADLTCVEAHSTVPTSLAYSNGVALDSLCTVNGFSDGVVTHTPSTCGGHLTEQWHTLDTCGRTLTASSVRTVLPAPEALFTSTLPVDTTVTCLEFITSYQRPTLTYGNGINAPIVCALGGTLIGETTLPPPLTPIPFRVDLCGTSLSETWQIADPCGRTLTHTRTLSITTPVLDTCCLAANEPVCTSYGLGGVFLAPTERCFFAAFAASACGLLGGTQGINQDACVAIQPPVEHCAGFVSTETICGLVPCDRRGVTKCSLTDGTITNTCKEGVHPSNGTCDGLPGDSACSNHGMAILEEKEPHDVETRKRRRKKINVCHIPAENPELAYVVRVKKSDLDDYFDDPENFNDRIGPCPTCICDDGYALNHACGACYSIESGDLSEGTVAVCRLIPSISAAIANNTTTELQSSNLYELHIVCDTPDNTAVRVAHKRSERPPKCSGIVQPGDIAPSFNGSSGLDCACRPLVGACYIGNRICRQTTQEACDTIPDSDYKGPYVTCPDCTTKVTMAVHLPGVPAAGGAGALTKPQTGSADSMQENNTVTRVAIGSVSFIFICVVVATVIYVVVKIRGRRNRRARHTGEDHYTNVFEEDGSGSYDTVHTLHYNNEIPLMEMHKE